jgi:hypothetical protein
MDHRVFAPKMNAMKLNLLLLGMLSCLSLTSLGQPPATFKVREKASMANSFKTVELQRILAVHAIGLPYGLREMQGRPEMLAYALRSTADSITLRYPRAELGPLLTDFTYRSSTYRVNYRPILYIPDTVTLAWSDIDSVYVKRFRGQGRYLFGPSRVFSGFFASPSKVVTFSVAIPSAVAIIVGGERKTDVARELRGFGFAFFGAAAAHEFLITHLSTPRLYARPLWVFGE